MPSLDNIEDYLASVEEYVHTSVAIVRHSLPDVHEAVNQLWVDISRYGPGLPAFPDMQIPALGDFPVPPQPPPHRVVPHGVVQRTADWVERNPGKTAGVVLGVVGAGLLVGYRGVFMRKERQHAYNTKKVEGAAHERRQIVVVLGGDTPHGLPLIQGLEKKGYIVIASVSTPEAVEALEMQCEGFVKAHILDPYQPAAIPVFLRSLSATLSRKFPIHAPGDPYVSPAHMPYIHSIVSLMTLSPPPPITTAEASTTIAMHAPFEHISMRDTYLPYLTASQITPLQIVQALLPLLRTGAARTRDAGANKCIVLCVPATDARVGLPFAAVQSMAAAGTLRAAEVLRREIRVAAMTQRWEAMQAINVVVVDVGAFDVAGAAGTGRTADGNVSPTPSMSMTGVSLPPEGVYKSMEGWSASEKVIYGPAFVAVMQEKPPPVSRWDQVRRVLRGGFGSGYGGGYGLPRKPTSMKVFVDNIVGVVSGGRTGPYMFGVGVGLGRLRNWLRGERFSVGAGALTYRVASHLPSIILDGLINLPHFLISLRNRLLPLQPFRDPPFDLPPPSTMSKRPAGSSAGSVVVSTTLSRSAILKRAGTEPSSPSPYSSELETNDADVESNAGDAVENSWVSLNSRHSEQHGHDHAHV
ncbi:hypothetical protein D9619_005467 [Psilocybe cf. subviscida]|uniref:DUF1776-domain-containing protein n=1 Tax=Psilocybe cf. subviscida TaxID=2480587 RepID=A0A8H5FBD3_9AGAR|nr:hypothetical protein D9619_005467 [Psilocybe cf. subviscida]